MQNWTLEQCLPVHLAENCLESDEFRAMSICRDNLQMIEKEAKQEHVKFSQVLSLYLYWYRLHLNRPVASLSSEQRKQLQSVLHRKENDAYEQLKRGCAMLFDDCVCFPVAESTIDNSKQVTYEDSWYRERTYGGKRRHEGTDIMASVNKRGLYPVVSVSEGVVEQIGWLNLGGYRLGIRSPQGTYFYYAHLASYARDFREGDHIYAGETIGLMGDTGYGAEGTIGQFDVHLHFGMYIPDTQRTDMSVNPYSVLQYVEWNRIRDDF